MWWAEQQWDIFLIVLQFSYHYHPISALYSFITDATKYLQLTKSLNNTQKQYGNRVNITFTQSVA